MSTVAGTLATAEPARAGRLRAFLWLLRRETWEHRAILVAPLAVLVIAIIGILSDVRDIPGWMNALEELAAEKRTHLLAALDLLIAVPFVLTMAIVAAFYCLDALYGERRDRSVLFWKSLPVSDLETVVSKLTMVAVVIPAIALCGFLIAQVLILGIAGLAVAFAGESPFELWRDIPLTSTNGVVVYALIVQSLWYLPLYAWLLLASAWATRAVLLWAVLPPFALSLLEQVVFKTNYVLEMVQHRLTGLFPLAFRFNETRVGIVIDDETVSVPERLTDILRPTEFLLSSGLWLGVLAAAALVAAAVWARRYREVN
jgi:ABC-2 type transport system permease protein